MSNSWKINKACVKIGGIYYFYDEETTLAMLRNQLGYFDSKLYWIENNNYYNDLSFFPESTMRANQKYFLYKDLNIRHIKPITFSRNFNFEIFPKTLGELRQHLASIDTFWYLSEFDGLLIHLMPSYELDPNKSYKIHATQYPKQISGYKRLIDKI